LGKEEEKETGLGGRLWEGFLMAEEVFDGRRSFFMVGSCGLWL